MAMVTKVFIQKGQSKTKSDAYAELLKLNPGDQYRRQKAAGSLGGSSNSGFLKRQGGTYTRTR